MSTEKKDPYKIFKDYKRKFVQLDRETALLLHIFTKDEEHSWEDIWLHDYTGVAEADYFIHEEAAKQLLDQLEGHWCVAFLETLIKECQQRIDEHWKEYKK